MCGRFSLSHPEQMAERFEAVPLFDDQLEPRFNIAPTQMLPVVVEQPTEAGVAAPPAGHPLRQVQLMRWGFRPAWSTDAANKPAPINARAETIQTNGLFRRAVTQGRCIIPADGFYEWHEEPGQRTKQPYFIHRRDGALFGFAGLWTRGIGAEGEPLATCAIITTAPNMLMQSIHTRMPAILLPEHEALWLDPGITDPHLVTDLLRPYPDDLLDAYRVGRAVSSPRVDDPSLLVPISGSSPA